MKSTRIIALTLSTALLAQACAKESQTDNAVETKTADGQLAGSISGDSADKRGVALIRVVNAVAASKGLQVRADDQRVLPATSFQQVSAYQPIDQTWANFQVGDGSGGTFVPLSTNREMLTDGHRYSVIVLRSEDGTKYETHVLKDVIENEPGKARVRVVHAAPGMKEVMIKARSGETMFEGVDYGDEAGYTSLVPWSGTLEVRSNDGKQVLLSMPKLAFDAGKSYTLVITRTAAGKLDAFSIEDVQTP